MSILDRFFRPRRTPGAWHARLAVQLATFDHEWAAQRGALLSGPGRPRLFADLTDREIDVALAHLRDDK